MRSRSHWDYGLPGWIMGLCRHKLQKRYDGCTQQYTTNSTGLIFFKVIDNAYVNLKEYFGSTDLMQYRDLSETLLTGLFQPVILQQYPELTESL